jgi:hypothetical protein
VNQQQYTTIFAVGAKMLASFDSTMAKASARLKSLQRTAEGVGASMKALQNSMRLALAGLASFAAGAVFKKIFTGAFEEAAKAQERVLSLTNELYIHMRKQGREAAAQQAEALLAYNKELAKTGVLSHRMYDAMSDSLSKIGLSTREMAEIEPVLADVLVRARGIRATTEDANELGETLLKVAKGGRLLSLMKFQILLGPSERARLKAYKDDWRGALNYLFFFLKTYKGFNEAAERTPLGQIQRMKNLFDDLSETIGLEMLPAQADMAAAWEKALPTVEPVLLGAMRELAELITRISNEIIALADRLQMPDAIAAVHDLQKAFHQLLNTLGLEWPEAGFFGKLIGASIILSVRILTFEVKVLEKALKAIKWLMDHIFFREAIAAYPKMVEQMNRIRGTVAGPAAAKATMPPVPDWVKRDPRLLKAYMQGAAPAAGGGAGVVPAYARPGGYGYGPQNAPPLPAATRPPVPVSRIPTVPAMPTTPIWGGGAGGGPAAGGGFIPAGATEPYGGAAPPPTGGVGGGGPAAGAAGGPTPPAASRDGAAIYSKLLEAYKGSSLIGVVPPDGARFGITTGSAEQWARFATAVAAAESGFNPRSQNLTDPGGSFGIFQYAHGQVPGGNAFDIDSSIAAFVRDSEASVRSGLRAGILGKRFSTIGSHPERTSQRLGEAAGIASRAQAAQANAPPPLLARAYQLGGIARRPQIASLAERGPEMVLPMAGRGALGIFGSLLGGLRGMAGGDTHHYNFSPTVTIGGNADERTMGEMDMRLRSLAREFMASFKEAQRQERRLSYESGYSS